MDFPIGPENGHTPTHWHRRKVAAMPQTARFFSRLG